MYNYEIVDGYMPSNDNLKMESVTFDWPKILEDHLKLVFPPKWVDRFFKMVDYVFNKKNRTV